MSLHEGTNKDIKQSVFMLTIRAVQFFGHENIQDGNMMNTYCLSTPFYLGILFFFLKLYSPFL
jgi:hypothetical protein